jgi:hypothetical protein
MLGELLDNERRKGHDASPAGLRRPPMELAARLHDALADHHAAPKEVDPLGAEAGLLTEPKAGIPAEQHEHPVHRRDAEARVSIRHTRHRCHMFR